MAYVNQARAVTEWFEARPKNISSVNLPPIRPLVCKDANQGLKQLKADLNQWASRVEQDVPAATQDRLETPLSIIKEAVEKFDGSRDVDHKKAIRDNLWKVREAISQQGEVSGEVKQSYEKLRNLALDNSWERQLKGFPSGTYTISPRASDLPNFQMINPQFLRGGQPDQEGAEWLLSYGVKTEIDLRGDDRDNQWNPPSWSPKNVIHVNVKDYGNPDFKQVEEFIEAVNKPENQPVFVHCKAGIGRTGLMTACWRISQGDTADQALAHEKINSYAGSLRQEQFVRDFETYWNSKTFKTAA